MICCSLKLAQARTMMTKTYGKLLHTEFGPMKPTATTPREERGQNALTQAGRPSQAIPYEAPKCGENRMVKHHDPSAVIHPEHDKKDKKDEKIGLLISIMENKKESFGYSTGLVVVGSPMGLPPRLPSVPAGQIVANKLARRPPRKFILEETNSYSGYDDEEQERPFKRIRPHDHQPPLHMVSP